MSNNLKNLSISVFSVMIVIGIGASACTAPSSTRPDPVVTLDTTAANYEDGNENGNGGSNTGTSVLGISASDLSAEESTALAYMREEEKLARDVYNVFYTVWGQVTFQNVAASEQIHMDQIKTMLDRYALTDPALDTGKFADPNLQALYDQLVAQGKLSLADALKVGATIEEIDIMDLQTRVAQTDNADVQLVYDNLMGGSYNHLNCFTGALTQLTGEVYQPQYLSVDLYQTIITSAAGNGSQNATTSGQGGNSSANNTGGQSNSPSASGSGVPQVNVTSVSTVHGTIKSFDLTGMNITLDNGTSLYVQLGNPRYNQSIGFAPAAGEGVTISGFVGNQGLYSAITVTLDSTSHTYAFRDENGRPLWGGGNGSGSTP